MFSLYLVKRKLRYRYQFVDISSNVLFTSHDNYKETVDVSRRWCTGVVFIQPGVKVNGAYYCDVLLLKQLLPDICQAAGDFCFLVHDACTRALSCCDTRLQTSHQKWRPNRQDLSSVDYRLLRVIQECVFQKQQGTSNIVDELWLLTEWHFINGMTYYISQGRVEAPIRIGVQLCYSSVANLLQYLCAKNFQNIMQLDKIIAKNKGCNVLPHSIYFTHSRNDFLVVHSQWSMRVCLCRVC